MTAITQPFNLPSHISMWPSRKANKSSFFFFFLNTSWMSFPYSQRTQITVVNTLGSIVGDLKLSELEQWCTGRQEICREPGLYCKKHALYHFLTVPWVGDVALASLSLSPIKWFGSTTSWGWQADLCMDMKSWRSSRSYGGTGLKEQECFTLRKNMFRFLSPDSVLPFLLQCLCFYLLLNT